MLFAFVALAGNASLIKKVGGYSNTKIHGYLMGAATVLGCFGYPSYLPIHTYIHTYVHTYVHTYIHTYIHTHIHTYIRTYIKNMHVNYLCMLMHISLGLFVLLGIM